MKRSSTLHLTALTFAILVAACDSKSEPAKAGATKTAAKDAAPGKATPNAKPDAEADAKSEAKPIVPAPPAPIDVSTFAPVDLSSIAALAKYTVNGPPGATITPDRVPFGETEPPGAAIVEDGFALHVWRSSIGAERTVIPMDAKMKGATYTETKLDTDKGQLDYTITEGGTVTHGWIQAKFSTLKGSVLCGPQTPVAAAEALEPYKQACATLAEKK